MLNMTLNERRRFKIARILELNDPFEFLGINLKDPELRKTLNATKKDLDRNNDLFEEKVEQSCSMVSAGLNNPTLIFRPLPLVDSFTFKITGKSFLCAAFGRQRHFRRNSPRQES